MEKQPQQPPPKTDPIEVEMRKPRKGRKPKVLVSLTFEQRNVNITFD
jgi:hypothetical protein